MFMVCVYSVWVENLIAFVLNLSLFYLSAYILIYLSIYLPITLSIYLSIILLDYSYMDYLFIHMSVCSLVIYLFICRHPFIFLFLYRDLHFDQQPLTFSLCPESSVQGHCNKNKI